MSTTTSGQKRPRIVVTNDDGITAKGIQSLAEAMTEFGDVYVVDRKSVV